MHQHGFIHDVLDVNAAGQIFARYECRDPRGTEVETAMPDIVGRCVQAVLYASGEHCGAQAVCGDSGLNVVDGYLSTSCECVEDPNAGQCFDPVDDDDDGVGNSCDNCDGVPNSDQADGDGDGIGDACDNCAASPNSTQVDSDSDGVGNVCDNCIALANAGQDDLDGDGVGGACDNCVDIHNTSQRDRDGDLVGDACDVDRDGDDVPNGADNCPDTPNPMPQVDSGNDGIGDACDGCDINRGLTYDCKPWWRAVMSALDVRLEALAHCLQKRGVDGPWGLWGDLGVSRWGGKPLVGEALDTVCHQVGTFLDTHAELKQIPFSELDELVRSGETQSADDGLMKEFWQARLVK